MAAVDPVFSRAVRLLLSNEEDAADQLRAMLDEALRNKYGVGVKLPGKYTVEESQVSVKKERKSNDYVSSPTKYHMPSPPSHSEESNEVPPGDLDDTLTMNLDLLQEDLTCVVCGLLNVGVRNQLVECTDCHGLYHQDCHKPPILEIRDVGSLWRCANCMKKKQATSSTKVPKSCSSTVSIPSPGGKSAFLSSPSSSHSGNSTHKSSTSKSSSSSSSHKSSKHSSVNNGSSSSHTEQKRHSSSASSSSSSSSSSHKSSHHKSRHSR